MHATNDSNARVRRSTEKLIYVLWKRPRLSSGDFASLILADVAPRLLDLGARGLSVNLADGFVAPAAHVRITRFDPTIAGTVSLWLDATGDLEPYERALGVASARIAGYLVAESTPIVNTTQRAPLGERTPGINMVACIERPTRLTWEAWIAHWLGHHAKVAIETQCTFSYVRNVVVRPVTEQAPPWAGIVEEGFPADAVADPMRWYRGEGSEETMRRNMARMRASVQAFLDAARVESHPMSEYRLKEPEGVAIA
jgi:hypothetical protein